MTTPNAEANTANPQGAAPQAAPAAPAAPAKSEEKGLWQSTKNFFSHPAVAYGGGAVLAVGAGYAAYQAGKKAGAEQAHMSLADTAAALGAPTGTMAG